MRQIVIFILIATLFSCKTGSFFTEVPIDDLYGDVYYTDSKNSETPKFQKNYRLDSLKNALNSESHKRSVSQKEVEFNKFSKNDLERFLNESINDSLNNDYVYVNLQKGWADFNGDLSDSLYAERYRRLNYPSGFRSMIIRGYDADELINDPYWNVYNDGDEVFIVPAWGNPLYDRYRYRSSIDSRWYDRSISSIYRNGYYDSFWMDNHYGIAFGGGLGCGSRFGYGYNSFGYNAYYNGFYGGMYDHPYGYGHHSPYGYNQWWGGYYGGCNPHSSGYYPTYTNTENSVDRSKKLKAYRDVKNRDMHSGTKSRRTVKNSKGEKVRTNRRSSRRDENRKNSREVSNRYGEKSNYTKRRGGRSGSRRSNSAVRSSKSSRYGTPSRGNNRYSSPTRNSNTNSRSSNRSQGSSSNDYNSRSSSSSSSSGGSNRVRRSSSKSSGSSSSGRSRSSGSSRSGRRR